jgi:hypothetical protein
MPRFSTFLFVALLAGCGSDDDGGGGATSGGGSGGSSGGTGGSGGGSGGGGGTGGANVVPAGSRILAIEAFHDGALDHATIVDQAIAVGVKGIPPTLAWAVLEPTAPVNGTSAYEGMQWIEALNLVYAPRELEVMLSIPTVDTVTLLLPPDLGPAVEAGTKKLSDADVIERMTKMLDALYTTADPTLKLPYVVVGNEVDIYLGAKPQSMWDEYKVFIEAARTHIKLKRPDTVVGVNIAFQGIKDPATAAKAGALIENMDAVFASYYLNGNDFGGPIASNVGSDIDTILAFAGDKPLIMKEFGYATAQEGNTESGQLDFVSSMFTAWDAHAEQMPYFVYSRMFDGDTAKCTQQAADYGFPNDQDFIAFLCTLGLRHFDDTAKPAWDTFVSAAEARGF